MNDTKMTTGLAQTWVAVTDRLGRTHLEVRWTPAPHDQAQVQVQVQVHATTHAA